MAVKNSVLLLTNVDPNTLQSSIVADMWTLTSVEQGFLGFQHFHGGRVIRSRTDAVTAPSIAMCVVSTYVLRYRNSLIKGNLKSTDKDYGLTVPSVKEFLCIFLFFNFLLIIHFPSVMLATLVF